MLDILFWMKDVEITHSIPHTVFFSFFCWAAHNVIAYLSTNLDLSAFIYSLAQKAFKRKQHQKYLLVTLQEPGPLGHTVCKSIFVFAQSETYAMTIEL